jgi:uncharacterized pyridoxal phosphate-containing UPF0001 family protein
MTAQVASLRPREVRAALLRVRGEAAAAGRNPEQVEVLAAVKYLPAELLPALAEGGVRLVGENRAQQLVAKATGYPELFTWDFIGNLQSRKVRTIVPYVRYIHSLCSDSALGQLERHAPSRLRVLVEVNLAGERGKGGVAPAALEAFVRRCPVPVVGLMTMPPATENPEHSRPYFAELRELAGGLGLRELSMGTSQDYRVALEEGATIVRLGTVLYRSGNASAP